MPLILLLTGVVTAVAVVLSLAQTKEYEATSRVVLSQSDPINNIIQSSQPINYDPEAARNTLVSLIKIEPVAERVKAAEGLDYSTGELLDKVTTEVESNSDIVLIKALDPDPQTAADISNGFAEQYQLYRQDTVRAQLEDAADVTRTNIDRLSPEEEASEQGRDLRAQLRQLEILAAAQRGGVEVAETADVPTDPAKPKPLLNGILAFVLGFGLAVAIAVGIEFIDRRLKDEEDVENAFAPADPRDDPAPRAPLADRRARRGPRAVRGLQRARHQPALLRARAGARVDHDHLPRSERGQDQRDARHGARARRARPAGDRDRGGPAPPDVLALRHRPRRRPEHRARRRERRRQHPHRGRREHAEPRRRHAVGTGAHLPRSSRRARCRPTRRRCSPAR